MQNKNYIRLDMGSGGNVIKPTISLICQIEDELGSVPALLNRFKSDNWKIADAITLVHMMLAEAGTSYDYHDLGNRIIRDGVNWYKEQMIVFLELCIAGTTVSYHKMVS